MHIGVTKLCGYLIRCQQVHVVEICILTYVYRMTSIAYKSLMPMHEATSTASERVGIRLATVQSTRRCQRAGSVQQVAMISFVLSHTGGWEVVFDFRADGTLTTMYVL